MFEAPAVISVYVEKSEDRRHGCVFFCFWLTRQLACVHVTAVRVERSMQTRVAQLV